MKMIFWKENKVLAFIHYCFEHIVMIFLTTAGIQFLLQFCFRFSQKGFDWSQIIDSYPQWKNEIKIQGIHI